jgi:hypothetical protein
VLWRHYPKKDAARAEKAKKAELAMIKKER